MHGFVPIKLYKNSWAGFGLRVVVCWLLVYDSKICENRLAKGKTTLDKTGRNTCSLRVLEPMSYSVLYSDLIQVLRSSTTSGIHRFSSSINLGSNAHITFYLHCWYYFPNVSAVKILTPFSEEDIYLIHR